MTKRVPLSPLWQCALKSYGGHTVKNCSVLELCFAAQIPNHCSIALAQPIHDHFIII